MSRRNAVRANAPELSKPAAQPIAAAEFTAALASLGPLGAGPHLTVAVSGGCDSLALAILADRWARGQGGAVMALIVDHKLRPTSSAEANLAREKLQARGIAAEILTAPDAPPITRIEESARALRYRLLLDWCQAKGVADLLTAHQGDDQAETVAMRLMRGSGLEGLAGISARTERDGVRILRPLLEFTRARLEATLKALGQDWIEDPSNRDARFERNRWRSAMTPALAQSLRALARRFAQDRQAIERRLAAWLDAHVRLDDSGVALVDGVVLAALPGEIALRIVARLIGTIGGRDYPPRRTALSAALAQLRAGKNAAAGGCLLMRRSGQIVVVRELAAIAAPEQVAAGEQRHWDGRFALSAPCAGWLGPLGPQGWAEVKRLDRPQAKPVCMPVLPAASFWALPALWSENSGNARKLLAIPDFLLLKHTGLAGFAPARLLPIAMRFLPHQPLAPPPFAIVLPAEAPIY